MTKTNYLRDNYFSNYFSRAMRTERLRALTLLTAAALAASLLLALVGVKPAQAAFPGINGKIAFLSNRDGNFEIYSMNPDGSNQTRLTNNSPGSFDPSFSPDGAKIAFESARDGNDEIYVMNSDGSNQTRLTNSPAPDDSPSFSPDGKKIAYSEDVKVYMMNSDGSRQKRLTNHPPGDVNPSFSPDGKKIAFRRDNGNDAEIYVMKAKPEGRKNHPRNLTKNAANDFDPDWGVVTA